MTETLTSFDKKIIFLIIVQVVINQTAISIYLPSLPSIVRSLQISEGYAQYTVTSYIMGFGIMGLIYGPLSDYLGRRKTALLGLSIFTLGSLLASITHSIITLLIARTLQGMGISAGDVMGRVVLCDLYDKKKFIKAAAYIGMAIPITPFIAPVIGGYLNELFGWQANFIFMLLLSLTALIIYYFNFPETKSTRKTVAFNTALTAIAQIIKDTSYILRNKIFIAFFAACVVAASGELAYGIIAPFVIQNELHWSASAYGLISGLIAIGYFFGAQLTNKFSVTLNSFYNVLFGLILSALAGLLMLIPSLFHSITIYSITLPMLLYLTGAGSIYPAANAGALVPFAEISGLASSVQGGLQYFLTGLIGFLLASFNFHSQISLAIFLLLLSVGTIVLFVSLMRNNKVNY